MSLRSFALCLVAAAAVHATPAPNYTPGKVCKVLALSGGGDKGAYEAGVVYVEVVETVETLLRAYASLVWMATLPNPSPPHTHERVCPSRDDGAWSYVYLAVSWSKGLHP